MDVPGGGGGGGVGNIKINDQGSVLRYPASL